MIESIFKTFSLKDIYELYDREIILERIGKGRRALVNILIGREMYI